MTPLGALFIFMIALSLVLLMFAAFEIVSDDSPFDII